MIDAGQILKMCREHKKWSIVTLGTEASVSPTTIKEIENGTRDCKVGTFEKLLEAMGYELEVLKIEEQKVS
ncbi:MAG: helix-turn-helix transcriptional regulator [Pseudobutyrivibrio sp.]|nr:helix-turn-helix transcriptional regulator [Pseudobutyrivibrio sp.]